MAKRHYSTLQKYSLALAAALILCVAVSLPYGFYTIIRFATTIIAGCWLYRFLKQDRKHYAIIAGSIMVLFQPFLKIALSRDVWAVIDVVVAFLILYALFKKRL